MGPFLWDEERLVYSACACMNNRYMVKRSGEQNSYSIIRFIQTKCVYPEKKEARCHCTRDIGPMAYDSFVCFECTELHGIQKGTRFV